jgi:hypothetical protein
MDIIRRNIYIKDTSYILTVQFTAENVFCRSNFEIMGSNPILETDVCLLCLCACSTNSLYVSQFSY